MTEDDTPNVGIDHMTVEVEDPTNPDRALVMTHPFDRFGADEDVIEDFLEEDETYDDVFYIGKNNGRIPVHVSTLNAMENLQSRLPPGFEDGHYEEGLNETSWGSLDDYTAGQLLEGYDEVAVAGAQRDSCVNNTLESLQEVRDSSERYASTEVYLEEDVTFPMLEEE